MTSKFLLLFGGFALATALASTAHAKPATVVNCDANRNNDIQAAVDAASPGDTIFINGNCTDQNVSITKDDITLSGNEADAACNRADPSASADATIHGTITVDGVRAKIEHLVITGSGGGVTIINRADVDLTCNDISDNEEEGVGVIRSSNAVLRDNTLSGNGRRETDPSIFFDCGLFAVDASSVRSEGNTYEDNQYCAVEIDRQSSFRNGAFLPRQAGPGQPANEKDVFTELGCDPGTGTGCFTTDGGPVALVVFNGGLVDLRNSEVNGEIEVTATSSLRFDADGKIQGNILNTINSIIRIRNREKFLGDRQVTFDGTLICDGSSQAYFSSVQCGETCSGIIGGDTLPNTCGGP